MQSFNNFVNKLSIGVSFSEETEAPPTPLNAVMPVQAITQSDSTIRLAWTDSNSYADGQRPTYTIIYREHDPKVENE